MPVRPAERAASREVSSMPVLRPPSLRVLPSAAFVLAACAAALPARGQIFAGGFFQPAVPGVYIEQDGNVRCREVDPTKQLADLRARAKAAAQAGHDEKLTFVSLP